MSTEKDIYILGIESSCDETAASVVKNGRVVLSNVISSQIDLHTLYGGVVPEIASRKHIERINQVIQEALDTAGMTLDDLDAIGVTYGPGLVAAAGGRPSYRGTYFRQLYRESGSGAALRVSGGIRRAHPSGGGTGLRKIRDPGTDP